jgi:threonyl-tRNA synthetase
LSYIGEDGVEHTPVVLHRAVTGTTERFLGVLIEHFAGAFPVWLAPVQAMLIPIADRHLPYIQEVAQKLKEAGLRVEIDERGERMNAKIRDAQRQKIPYMLVVGDQEVAQGQVALRMRSGENPGPMPVQAFLERARQDIRKGD